MKSRFQELIMIITYGLLVYLAIWFYRTSEVSSAQSGMIYTVILFVIVLAMYIYSFTGFIKINKMISALNKFRKKISKDFQALQDSERAWENLWDKYKNEEIWFSEKTLDAQVGKYITKTKINEQTVKGAFFEDIEEYIGYDLIDDKIHKEVISAFPGIMTGLGILFTFFGLSICLQSFSTSSAEEIMAGIDPLMGGLKVAFHTSIYGLIFSMVFNFCYRKKLEDGYNAVHDFIDEFKRCVRPENQNDGMNKLIAYEATQLALIKSISNTIVGDLSDAFYKVMTPQFEQMNSIIENFANVASKAQTDGMQRMVGAFLMELNNAIGSAYEDVRNSIWETCEIQKGYNVHLQQCLGEMSKIIEDIRNVSIGMDVSVSKMEGYYSGMQDLQVGVQDSFTAYSGHVAYNNDVLAKQQETFVRMTQLQQSINEKLLKLQESTDNLNSSLSDVTSKLDEFENETITNSKNGMAQIEKEIENLKDVMNSSNDDTIADIDEINIELDPDFEKIDDI